MDAMRGEALLRRDRRLVACALAALAALAWAYQLYMAWGMEHVSRSMAAIMPNMQAWGARDVLLLFAMWAVMMIAMMVPSATPMVLIFAAVTRQRQGERHPRAATAVFVLGYLGAWLGFSAVATIAQWHLHRAELVSSAMVATSPVLGGILLVATGVFQWTRFKDACLSRCRSPIGFVLGHWRDGLAGAFRMGLVHGCYCVGCCALLMALLFVNGVMNVVWMVVVTIFVMVEKMAPAPAWTARVVGALLCGWGIWMIAATP